MSDLTYDIRYDTRRNDMIRYYNEQKMATILFVARYGTLCKVARDALWSVTASVEGLSSAFLSTIGEFCCKFVSVSSIMPCVLVLMAIVFFYIKIWILQHCTMTTMNTLQMLIIAAPCVLQSHPITCSTDWLLTRTVLDIVIEQAFFIPMLHLCLLVRNWSSMPSANISIIHGQKELHWRLSILILYTLLVSKRM